MPDDPMPAPDADDQATPARWGVFLLGPNGEQFPIPFCTFRTEAEADLQAANMTVWAADTGKRYVAREIVIRRAGECD